MSRPRYCEECGYFGWFIKLSCCDTWVCDSDDDRNGNPCYAMDGGDAPNTGCRTWTDNEGNVHTNHWD